MHGKTSVLRHSGVGLFDGMGAPMVVGRYHSLVVDAPSLPGELEPTAFAVEDGEVMALRHRKHPTVGVQFHPESILTPDGPRLLKNFLEGRLC
jgi:anthranilate synthase component 2